MVLSFCAVAAAAAVATPVSAATRLVRLTEPAAFQKSGADAWRKATTDDVLEPGDHLRTGVGGSATLVFEDSSQIELGPSANFLINDIGAGKTTVELSVGFLRAFISKVAARQFRVRTPTAVCAVRGTEFSIDVNAQGHTNVQMFSGVLAVADSHGNETVVKDQQSVRVTDKGLGAVQTNAKQTSLDSHTEKLKNLAKREVGLEMSKEAVQSAAASEAKNAVYQQGKAIIDVNGQRVRIEEYIIRPTANSFKLVVLNERATRFDYFYYHGIFNTTLPDDLSVALRQLPGCIGSACQYFMTGFDTARSNTIDNMLEVATGGHLVDVNNDGNATDAVTAAFNPATNQFTGLNVPNAGGVGNDKFFQTLYNTDRLTFNGNMHTSWTPQAAAGAACGTPGNTCSMAAAEIAVNNVTTVQFPPTCGPPNCTYNESGVMHQVVYSQDGTGATWDKFDSYIISDKGKVASAADFAGVTSGASYKQTLLNWNFEQIVTASEFQGRKIDLAVEPKIFIQSGLIP
jgi:hypothetical protein